MTYYKGGGLSAFGRRNAQLGQGAGFRSTQQWNDYIAAVFGGTKPTMYSTSHPQGFFPTLDQVATVYRSLLAEAVGARDANGVLVVLNNWEDSNRRLGGGFLPGDAELAAQARKDAGNRWGAAQAEAVVAVAVPGQPVLSVVRRPDVESGKIKLTVAQLDEYNRAIAASPQSVQVGLSTALQRELQADKGDSWQGGGVQWPECVAMGPDFEPELRDGKLFCRNKISGAYVDPRGQPAQPDHEPPSAAGGSANVPDAESFDGGAAILDEGPVKPADNTGLLLLGAGVLLLLARR